MTTAGLSPQLRDCLTAIRDHMAANCGASPTYRDIARALGLSSGARAHFRVRELEDRGYVTRVPGKKCSIALVKRNEPELSRKLRRRLVAYCRRHGERPAGVLCDALSLFLDGADSDRGCRAEMTSAGRERVL